MIKYSDSWFWRKFECTPECFFTETGSIHGEYLDKSSLGIFPRFLFFPLWVHIILLFALWKIIKEQGITRSHNWPRHSGEVATHKFFNGIYGINGIIISLLLHRGHIALRNAAKRELHFPYRSFKNGALK